MSLGSVFTKVKPYLAMIFLQFGYAGMYVISVASLKRGMNHYVLVVYRNVIAAVVMAPFALCFERKVRPKMTLSIFLKIMALGLLKVLEQNFYYMGGNYTSASFAAALFNTIPAMTFVMAIILRMEKVNIKKRHTQAKVVGTLLTVAGARMILYKGPIVEFFWTKGQDHHNINVGQEGNNRLISTFMLLWSCFCRSGFFMLQLNTIRSYPAKLSLTTLIRLMGAVESAAVSLVMAHGTKPWSIGWDSMLFTAIYSGIMSSVISYYVQGLVMKERGPVFVTAFNPLCTIIVAVMGSILLAEDITLGMVIGAVIIVVGFYSLIWGKSKDHLSQSSEKEGSLELPIQTDINQ